MLNAEIWTGKTWEKLWNFSKFPRKRITEAISSLVLELGLLDRIFLMGWPYAVNCFWSIDVWDALTAEVTALAKALPDCFLQYRMRNQKTIKTNYGSQILFEFKPCAWCPFLFRRYIKNIVQSSICQCRPIEPPRFNIELGAMSWEIFSIRWPYITGYTSRAHVAQLQLQEQPTHFQWSKYWLRLIIQVAISETSAKTGTPRTTGATIINPPDFT